jgi:TPR repeat protein
MKAPSMPALLAFLLLVPSLLVPRSSAQQLPRADEETRRMQRLAEEGNVRAMFNLGVMYEKGQGGLRIDNTQARYWYEKAAKSGDVNAQYNLGLMHAHGRGTPKSTQDAIFWFRKAADAGDPGAQYNLAVMYDQGLDGERSRLEATDWFKRSAERGHAKAQYSLAVMYANGQGVPQDPVEAYKWMNLAADQGLAEAVVDRRDLVKKLSDAEVRAGESRAVQFREKSGPVSAPINRKR